MGLSTRQSHILDFIRAFLTNNGYPPTIREIGQGVSITSTSVVNYNLNVLENAGCIVRDRTISRGIKLKEDVQARVRGANLITVPLLGRIAAGKPIPVPEDSFSGEMLEMARDLVPGGDNVYALQVRGNSMIDALINDGDIVLLQYQRTANDRDMIAAWLVKEEETTLKRYFHEGNRIRLQPENSQMAPIYVDPANLEIQGKVVAVIRKYS